MKKTIKLLALCCLFNTLLFAQQSQGTPTRKCGTMPNLEIQLAKNPRLAKKMNLMEQKLQKRIARASNRIDGNIVTIPVVVHVVYNTQNQNISDAQVISQIEVLNEDFRRLNSDKDDIWPQARDMQIEFCLATVAPNGDLTNGITRKSTNKRGFDFEEMKFSSQGGTDAWDTSQYLNMWVVPFSDPGLLGYAQFPGQSAETDGVVIAPQFFGSSAKGNGFFLSSPFDLGRTTTHEVGHFLNLRHIWGDGDCSDDDFVADTPNAEEDNTGCSIGNRSCGSIDMVQNYMDYSNDGCMNLFTNGQKSRMRAVLLGNGLRSSLANSTACAGTVDPDPNPKCTDIELSLTFDNYPEETSFEIRDDNGKVLFSGENYKDRDKGKNIIIPGCLDNGCYELIIKDSYGDGICCSYGVGSYELKTKDGKVLVSGAKFSIEDATKFCLGKGSRIDKSFNTTRIDNYSVKEIKIYPNPLTGNVLNIIGASYGDVYQVVNLQGRVLISQILTGKTIDLKNLAEGMYILKLGEGNAQAMPFVKK